jgi:hypothetical protein
VSATTGGTPALSFPRRDFFGRCSWLALHVAQSVVGSSTADRLCSRRSGQIIIRVKLRHFELNIQYPYYKNLIFCWKIFDEMICCMQSINGILCSSPDTTKGALRQEKGVK